MLLLRSFSSLLLLSVPAFTASLTVAAASDLAPVEPSLQAAFLKIYPSVKLTFVTGASGVLAQQIASGAPFDVFLSANVAYIRQLVNSRKIEAGSVQIYARGRVAILWRDGKSHDLRDLKEAAIQSVALPNPKLAPYGVAAEAALRHAGVWDAVRPKLVYGENVRQALQFFDSGNADAVLTAASLLNGRRSDLIPSSWHSPVLQEAGVIKDSADARAFLGFLASPAGQAIFSRYGFSVVAAKGL